MKKAILVILLASAVVLISTCAKREEGRCRLRYREVDTSESTINYARQDQAKLSEKPAQLIDLPKKISGRISYFLAKIADREIPLIIDRGRKSRLYMDTDADGYLSDEKGFASKTVKRRLFGPVDYYRFGPISVEFGQSDGKLVKRIYVITSSPNIEYLCICPADYRKGKVRLGQNIYEVAIVDGNFDGKYGKILSPPLENIWRPECDSFFIDLNRDGKMDWSLFVGSELKPLSRMIKIGNTYYSIDVDPEGMTLELKQVEPEFGTLDLGGADVRIKLWSDAAEQSISGSEGDWRLPAGKYTALFIELIQKDSSGDRWIFRSDRAEMIKLKYFEIIEGQKTQFKIGPPFSIKTSAEQHGEIVLIDFGFEGQCGERYSPRVRKGRVTVPEPNFKIIDEFGKVLDFARFEYGRGWVCQYSWRVPDDFKGKYRVHVQVEMEPLEVKQDETWHVIE